MTIRVSVIQNKGDVTYAKVQVYDGSENPPKEEWVKYVGVFTRDVVAKKYAENI